MHRTLTIIHRIDEYIDQTRIPPGETKSTMQALQQLQLWLTNPKNEPLHITQIEYLGHWPHPTDPNGDPQPIFHMRRTDQVLIDLQYHPDPQHCWHYWEDAPTDPLRHSGI